MILNYFGRFSTWQCEQRIQDFDSQAHEVDELQLAFDASAVLPGRVAGLNLYGRRIDHFGRALAVDRQGNQHYVSRGWRTG